MKKLFAIIAIASFVACNNTGEEKTTTTDSTKMSTDTSMNKMSTDTSMNKMSTDTSMKTDTSKMEKK